MPRARSERHTASAPLPLASKRTFASGASNRSRSSAIGLACRGPNGGYSTEPTLNNRRDNSRHIRARRGSDITAKHWTTEAAVRLLMNNLDEEVAEDPQNLVVYGGIGRAARNW